MAKVKTQEASEGNQEKTKPVKAAKPAAQAVVEPQLTCDVDSDGIAVLSFSTPNKKVNLLSPAMLADLENMLNDLSSRTDIKAVIFASKKTGNFMAGADLMSMAQDFSVEKAAAFANTGRALFQRIAEFDVPTIAAINGLCLGGGTELCLACDYRVAANHAKVKIGLPEVKLGILPGWGGTQRLPRLIALPDALDMMLTGKNLNARKAQKIGLVDLTPPLEMLLETARKVARDALAGKTEYVTRKREHKNLRDQVIDRFSVAQNLVFKQARKDVLDKTKGFYPAPLKILEAVQQGLQRPLYEAFQIEARAFQDLLERVETRNLMNLFFISQELGKVPETEDGLLEPADINYLAVMGAGAMGAGIAQAANHSGLEVRMRDVSYPALLKGMEAVNSVYKGLLKRKRLKPEDVDNKLRHLTITTDYSGLKRCDLVIEAIVEKLDAKQALFAELENHVGEQTIFASNTSSLSINAMAECTKRPDRFIGLHFFNPVHKMPLVEVIKGDKTSLQTLATALNFVKALGKTPVVVKDTPGFFVNRILAVYGNEAGLLLEEGADIATMDRLMVDFGMPMGFFEVADLAGLDIAYHAGQSMLSLFVNREGNVSSKVLEVLFKAGRLGKKSGKGFYIHAGEKPIPDHRYLREVVKQLHPDREPRQISFEEIRDRLILSMLNEAVLCLQEGVVAKPGDADMAMIMGTGFPPFRGGLLRQVDQQGVHFILNQLAYYAETRGARFKPCALLQEMAAAGQKFYPLI